jgi:hypothetical protein
MVYIRVELSDARRWPIHDDLTVESAALFQRERAPTFIGFVRASEETTPPATRVARIPKEQEAGRSPALEQSPSRPRVGAGCTVAEASRRQCSERGHLIADGTHD